MEPFANPVNNVNYCNVNYYGINHRVTSNIRYLYDICSNDYSMKYQSIVVQSRPVILFFHFLVE